MRTLQATFPATDWDTSQNPIPYPLTPTLTPEDPTLKPWA